MLDFFEKLFDATGFVPRAICGEWTRGEVLLNNISDALIALAYLAIPIILVYFARRRKDLPYSWLFPVFGAFIITCGGTHVMEIILFYHPIYRMAGLLKAITAIASWVAALALLKVVPAALTLRSPRELEILNEELNREIQVRKAAEAELEKRNRELKETEKLKDQFMANVSHELRTPLTLILAPVESMLATAQDPQQRATLELVRSNAVRLLQQVNDLLDFSRLEAGRLEIHREPTQIEAFTRNLVAAFQSLADERGVALTIESECPTTHLLDRYLYERILFNLLSNALKFTPRGGRVCVHLRCPDDRIVVEVKDTGSGIHAEELPYIFDRFRQTGRDDRRSGTGLGLTMVREFASVLGGRVTVESQLEQGSRFTVELLAPLSQLPDLVQAEPDIKLPRPVILPSESSAGEPVLIAEDNPELGSYMAVVLRGVADVRVVRDGDEAWETVQSWRPALLLSDVMMPGLSGFQLCRKIKSDPELANLPVVLITALTHREALLEGWEAGADEFLFKPFHPTELVTRVRSLLGISQARRSLEQELRRRVEERTHSLSLANRAKSVFLGNLSHELRTPLAGILGLTEVAINEAVKPEVIQHLAAIRKAARGLDVLLADLLEFSRIESAGLSLRIGKFRVEEVLDQVRATLISLAEEKSLDFRTSSEWREDQPLLGDDGRLRHILLNLSANALKFTDRGRVELRAVVKLETESDVTLRFEVEDTGIGIDEQDLKRVAEPFMQLHQSLSHTRPGAGIGLTIVHELLRLMGSKLEVHSTPGQGSCFGFELRVRKAETEPKATSLGNTGHILLVEDNFLNRRVLSLLLERAGNTVVAAETAEAGLQAYEKDKFDLVVMDLQLPGMDGIEATKRIRQEPPPHPPVVALTAHAGDHYRKMCEEVGMVAFLTKPVETEKLLEVISSNIKARQ